MPARSWVKFIILVLMTMLLIQVPHATFSQPVIPMMRSLPPLPLKTTPSRTPTWARLIDLRSVNPSILLDIRYASANNFLGRRLYPAERCILRAAVAEQLSQVQQDLQQQGLGLKVFDGYRPLSVQRQMWEILPDSRYVANPTRGSRHNRGAAVDVTLVDAQGRELEMPTDFDDFTPRASRSYQGQHLSHQAQQNRELLAQVMQKYGFVPLETEWWHFDAADWQRYSVLDIPFSAIPETR